MPSAEYLQSGRLSHSYLTCQCAQERLVDKFMNFTPGPDACTTKSAYMPCPGPCLHYLASRTPSQWPCMIQARRGITCKFWTDNIGQSYWHWTYCCQGYTNGNWCYRGGTCSPPMSPFGQPTLQSSSDSELGILSVDERLDGVNLPERLLSG